MRSHDRVTSAALRPAVAPVSSDFSQQILRDGVAQHAIDQQSLELPVLVLKLEQNPITLAHIRPR